MKHLKHFLCHMPTEYCRNQYNLFEQTEIVLAKALQAWMKAHISSHTVCLVEHHHSQVVPCGIQATGFDLIIEIEAHVAMGSTLTRNFHVLNSLPTLNPSFSSRLAMFASNGVYGTITPLTRELSLMLIAFTNNANKTVFPNPVGPCKEWLWPAASIARISAS